MPPSFSSEYRVFLSAGIVIPPPEAAAVCCGGAVEVVDERPDSDDADDDDEDEGGMPRVLVLRVPAAAVECDGARKAGGREYSPPRDTVDVTVDVAGAGASAGVGDADPTVACGVGKAWEPTRLEPIVTVGVVVVVAAPNKSAAAGEARDVVREAELIGCNCGCGCGWWLSGGEGR